jgi:hypothetical protein
VNLVLGNIDYRLHTTDEGDQLQRGLEHAGWTLAGAGYGDGCRDVPTLLERFRPAIVFCSDPRDWDPQHDGSFRKDIGFERIEVLRDHPEIFRVTVVKDAGSVKRYQERKFREMGADAAVVYYDPGIVRRLNPWLADVPLIRTHHSIDAELCARLDLRAPRERAVATGATSTAYPLRTLIMQASKRRKDLGVFVGHPGYHNRGAHTPEYLRLLAGYRVHVATASRYGFALRKIIESVAVCATPVTNLPAFDVLPEIDGALVRVSDDASLDDVAAVIAAADGAWDLEERLAWAEKAWRFYDWRGAGLRLAAALEEAAIRRIAA